MGRRRANNVLSASSVPGALHTALTRLQPKDASRIHPTPKETESGAVTRAKLHGAV